MPRWFVFLAFLSPFLSELIVNLPAALGDEPSRWTHEVRTGRFEIHCDFKLNAEDALLRELKEITEDVESLLGYRSEQAPIHIVLFATESEYQRYMQTYFPSLPKRRALFLQDRGPGMLFTHWHSNVDSDLRHEVAHALLNQRGRPLPLWLDEGLAEYFEVRRQHRFQGNSYTGPVSDLVAKGNLQPIHRLASQANVAKLSDADYRDSWAWVHFLIHRNTSTRALLVRYIQTQQGKPSSVSGQAKFDLDRALRAQFQNLDKELREHFASLLPDSRLGGPTQLASTTATSGAN